MTNFVEITRHSRVKAAMSAAWRWQYRNRKAIARRINRIFYAIKIRNHEI